MANLKEKVYLFERGNAATSIYVIWSNRLEERGIELVLHYSRKGLEKNKKTEEYPPNRTSTLREGGGVDARGRTSRSKVNSFRFSESPHPVNVFM